MESLGTPTVCSDSVAKVGKASFLSHSRKSYAGIKLR